MVSKLGHTIRRQTLSRYLAYSDLIACQVQVQMRQFTHLPPFLSAVVWITPQHGAKIFSVLKKNARGSIYLLVVIVVMLLWHGNLFIHPIHYLVLRASHSPIARMPNSLNQLDQNNTYNSLLKQILSIEFKQSLISKFVPLYGRGYHLYNLYLFLQETRNYETSIREITNNSFTFENLRMARR